MTARICRGSRERRRFREGRKKNKTTRCAFGICRQGLARLTNCCKNWWIVSNGAVKARISRQTMMCSSSAEATGFLHPSPASVALLQLPVPCDRSTLVKCICELIVRPRLHASARRCLQRPDTTLAAWSLTCVINPAQPLPHIPESLLPLSCRCPAAALPMQLLTSGILKLPWATRISVSTYNAPTRRHKQKHE